MTDTEYKKSLRGKKQSPDKKSKITTGTGERNRDRRCLKIRHSLPSSFFLTLWNVLNLNSRRKSGVNISFLDCPTPVPSLQLRLSFSLNKAIHLTNHLCLFGQERCQENTSSIFHYIHPILFLCLGLVDTVALIQDESSLVIHRLSKPHNSGSVHLNLSQLNPSETSSQPRSSQPRGECCHMEDNSEVLFSN